MSLQAAQHPGRRTQRAGRGSHSPRRDDEHAHHAASLGTTSTASRDSAGAITGAVDSQNRDSGTAAVYTSPWTGSNSPSSSDFETISESEVPDRPPSGIAHRGAYVPSNLARSLPQHRRMREDSYDSSADWAGLAETADRAGGLGGLLDEERHRRGIEGDDEDSSAFEDVEDGRGRARTRRVRGPELKKSMLEEALRSSLATLLSLAPVQAGLSQTPSMSYASLASLFQPTASSTSASSSSTAGFAPQATSYTGGHRPTPFASALSDPLEEDDEESPARQVLADVLDSSFSSAPSSGDATSFAPTRFTGTRAIPISRARDFSRSYSDSLPASSSDYSPLQPSQPLGVPTSDSPSVWSRRRTSAGTGVMRRRGRGRGGSTSPGPASVEERRRARAAAAAGSAGASASLAELKEGGESAESEEGAVTEGEGKMVERDEAFHDLLETARFFSDLSPRASRGTSYFSQPSSYDSANTTLPARPLATSAAWSSNPLFQSLSATTTPPLSSGEDDPALASESVPTLEGLSSEGDEHSPAPTGVPEQDEKGRPVKPEGAKGEGQRSRGFFPWLRKLGSTVEVKVWHLVGICGVLLGAGWAAGTLIRTLAPASWLASHLTFIHTNGSLLPAASSSSALSASTTLNGQVSPSHEKMSALFL